MLYTLCHSLAAVIFKIFFRREIVGVENLPQNSGVVLFANHVSYLDPPLLGSALPSSHKVYFMAKKELFDIPIFGWLLLRLGAFPVKKKGVDRSAIKRALDLLRNDEYVGVFPEGTRNRSGGEVELYNGAVLLARKVGVPVVPVGLVNTDRVLPDGYFIPRFKKLKVIVGEPIFLDDQEDLSRATSRIMDKVFELVNSNK